MNNNSYMRKIPRKETYRELLPASQWLVHRLLVDQLVGDQQNAFFCEEENHFRDPSYARTRA